MSYIPLILCLLYDNDFKEEYTSIFLQEIPQLVLSIGLELKDLVEEKETAESQHMPVELTDVVMERLRDQLGIEIDPDLLNMIANANQESDEDYSDAEEQSDQPNVVTLFSEFCSSITCQLFHSSISKLLPIILSICHLPS